MLQSESKRSNALTSWWFALQVEPSYATLRQDPRFQELISNAQQHIAGERRELDRMRAEGLVPDRSAGAKPPD